MKIKNKNTFIIILTTLSIIGCSDYLDIIPDNIATIDDAFDDENSAESYLFTCYSYMPQLGSPVNNPGFYGGDESFRDVVVIRTEVVNQVAVAELAEGVQQADNPILDYWRGGRGGSNLYKGIRDCNEFLENIDKVITIDENLKQRWIAEVKFLKAFYHFYLFRMYGPIVINDKNLPIDVSIDDIHKFRSTVDECATYIADLFLESSANLPLFIGDAQTELGRVTKAAAFAMRAKVLTTVASPLFNGNSEYTNLIDKNGTRLFSEFDSNKWEMAAKACKMAIDSIEAIGIELYEFNKTDLTLPLGVGFDDVPQEIINTLTIQQSLSERWTDEKFFVSTKGLANILQNHAQARTHVRFQDNTACYGFYSPTLRVAEMFYTKNGVPIDEDITWDFAKRYELREYDVTLDTDSDLNNVPDNKYFVKDGETTVKLHFDREVRFYGSLGFDRGIWYGNPATYNVTGAPAGFEDHYLEGRGGEYSGNAVGIGRFSQTGYYPKKLTNFDNSIREDDNTYAKIVYAFPEMRLADLYLLYAECLNEIDDRSIAYIYMDKVRARANLKGVVESWANFSNKPNKPASKDGLRSIIQQERMIELVFEGHRLWDLKRWKLAEDLLSKPYKGWNYTGLTAQDFYTPVTIGVPTYSFRNNLWPIHMNELLSNPNLIQNGGW